MTDVGGSGVEVIDQFDTVVLERVGSVAVVRLNRPDRLNAFTFQMRDDIVAAFDRTDADETVRAVVVIGTGRAFCAGADLAAGGETFAPEPGFSGVPPDSGGTTALRIYHSLKPVVVAINGPCAGVGVTLTLPADLRLAADDARFAFVFTRRGLVPEACSTWFLPRIVGIQRALRWTLAAETVSATEAREAGLVSEVVPKEEILSRAIALAQEFTDGTAPVSVALTRRMMWEALGARSPESAHEVESRALYSRGRSADVREGVAAFLEKRSPTFSDTVTSDLPEVFADDT